MKMQSLAVIFVIIMIPITLVISTYTQSQIDTLTMQTSYDTQLSNATYDAVKAFQLNELNSNTQNIDTEKIRDIEASINTFYNSLATSLGISGYKEDELKDYVPALVYTLYDGYYIYAPFYDIEKTNENGTKGKYSNGLKPYIYYTERYQNGTNLDITINYTLDNYITVYGTLSDGSYVTRSGYLINPDDASDDGTTYKGISIGTELLEEINDINYATKTRSPYVYTYSQGQKVYNSVTGTYETTVNSQRKKVYTDDGGASWYEITVDRRKNEIRDNDQKPTTLQDNSAQQYYKEAKEFSKWVEEKLGGLQLKNVVATTAQKEKLIINAGNENQYIFNFDATSNDPEKRSSYFNEHRRNVIKNSILSNLATAIAGYNSISQVNNIAYNFKLPVLQEDEWDSILENVSVISFLQGLPIKNKYYNGYSIVTNNQNKEFVDPKSIYFIDHNNPGKYHSIEE